MKTIPALLSGLLFVALATGLARGEDSAAALRICGSDTMIELVEALARTYVERHPEVEIEVTASGSGIGLAKLIAGECEIANSSRLMRGEEVALAAKEGVELKRVILAMDGLSVVTHLENPVRELTKRQLGQVFRGEIANWKQLGGADEPIVLYGRDPDSGTYGFFREYCVKGEYDPAMKQLASNDEIVEAVLEDAAGIGYVGVAFLRGEKRLHFLRVAPRPDAEPASPLSSEDVRSGRYPLARPLHQFVLAESSPAVRDLIAFALSEEGQRTVEEQGFFPVPEAYRVLNARAGW